MTTTERPAKLAFLTDPEPGRVFLLNIQEEGQECRRYQITREQLLNLNHQTADVLRRAFR